MRTYILGNFARRQKSVVSSASAIVNGSLNNGSSRGMLDGHTLQLM
jgi:hypothetical protein